MAGGCPYFMTSLVSTLPHKTIHTLRSHVVMDHLSAAERRDVGSDAGNLEHIQPQSTTDNRCIKWNYCLCRSVALICLHFCRLSIVVFGSGHREKQHVRTSRVCFITHSSDDGSAVFALRERDTERWTVAHLRTCPMSSCTPDWLALFMQLSWKQFCGGTATPHSSDCTWDAMSKRIAPCHCTAQDIHYKTVLSSTYLNT